MTDDDGTEDDDGYKPEKGEVVRFTGISWDPWLLVVEVGEERAKFAITDNTDDDEYTTLSDSQVREIEETVGDRGARQRLAEAVLADDDIDLLTAPFTRFEPLNQPHIQGAGPGGKGMHVPSVGTESDPDELQADGGESGYYAPRDAAVPEDDADGYMTIGVDDAHDVVGRYWIPVEGDLVESEHVPEGEIVQFPKEARDPERRGDREVPDSVQNWDHRDDEVTADAV